MNIDTAKPLVSGRHGVTYTSPELLLDKASRSIAQATLADADGHNVISIYAQRMHRRAERDGAYIGAWHIITVDRWAIRRGYYFDSADSVRMWFALMGYAI